MTTGEEVRCTDEKLFQLCKDFDDHVDRFEKHVTKEECKFDKLIEAQQKNTFAISELTGQISSLVSDTRDIVQLHRDFQGATRVGKSVQGLMIWLLKWGGVFGGLTAGISWVIEHFSKPPIS